MILTHECTLLETIVEAQLVTYLVFSPVPSLSFFWIGGCQRNVAASPRCRVYVNRRLDQRTLNVVGVFPLFKVSSTIEPSGLRKATSSKPLASRVLESIRQAPGKTNLLACPSAV